MFNGWRDEGFDNTFVQVLHISLVFFVNFEDEIACEKYQISFLFYSFLIMARKIFKYSGKCFSYVRDTKEY